MVLSAPATVAAESDTCLRGLGLSASTMHREALRQGQRAMDLRDADARLTQHKEQNSLNEGVLLGLGRKFNSLLFPEFELDSSPAPVRENHTGLV